MTSRGPGRLPAAATFATATAAAGWWTWRHVGSQAVAAWAPGRGGSVRAGPVRLRVLGEGEPVVLLLHGLLGAGNSFGSAYDEIAQHGVLVVPDLLGFGGSMQPAGSFDAAAHIAALDAALAALQLDQRPTVVAGHSLGGLLALQWAARHVEHVQAVVTLAAPLYLDRDEAQQHINAMGPLYRLLSGDGPLPQAMCAWMCAHRDLSALLAVATRPDLPVPVARSAVQHTWESYSGVMDGIIRRSDWSASLEILARAAVPVTLAEGARDPVLVPGRARALAAQMPAVRHVQHRHADHNLPIADPDWCVRLIRRRLRAPG